RRGVKVYVPRLRAEAEILEVSGDVVRVAAGPLKLAVTAAELRAPAPQAPAAPVRTAKGTIGRAASAALEPAIQTSDNSVALRGLRADDALSLATTFLDRSLNAGRRVAFLVHGHGTGALRDAIRKDLRGSPYVRHFRAGEASEGGDGV